MALDVEVRRSTRRRKTVSARMEEGRLLVFLPSWMSKAEEAKWVADMTRRFERVHRSEGVDLRARARSLARTYELPTPTEIQWSDNQNSLWGSCTPEDGTIRISRRLAEFPVWVLDYVVLHELIHLKIPGHTPEFHERLARYPRAERAIGYLLAKGFDPT